MGTPNKVTEEIKVEIVRRWNAGEAQTVIARALHLNRSTVGILLHELFPVETPLHWQGGRLNLPRPRPPKPKKPLLKYPDNPPVFEQALELYPGEAERFWGKVAPTNENGCRLWLAGKHSDGSGQFGGGRVKNERAYRVAWRLTYGLIPPGKQINHRCDVRACNEPTHLWCGTQQENVIDCYRKGRRIQRGKRGPNNNKAKLTWALVREMRRLRRDEGLPLRELCRRFGISKPHASHIILNRVWIE
jgi:hypothetical protein